MKQETTNIPIELLRKYDRPGPRYTSYPTVPVWSNDITHDDYVTALRTSAGNTDEPIAMYLHIPFCQCRCYYCGCNTFITKSDKRVREYVDLLCREIIKIAELLGKRNKISQLHFGGGTPTYLSIEQFSHILDTLEEHFTFVENCEKSIEVDPRVTTEEHISYLTSRGFNRISLGVQDFDSKVQDAIGRIQPFEKVKELLELCREKQFEGINFDLIYGLPHQTDEKFRETINKVIDLRPDRIALYSFAYLPSAKAHQSKIDSKHLPVTEMKYQLFAAAIELFTEAGYQQIGMDHFALPEDELSKAQTDGRLHRNFMGYTVQSCPEMIGIGMSSIGYINNSFFQNYSTLDKYMNAIKDDKFSVFRGMILSEDDLIRQYVINSLMCNFVLDFNTFKNKFNISYHDYFSEEHKKLSEFFVDNLMEPPNGKLQITPVGRTFIRNIAMSFDAYLDKDLPGEKPTFSRTI